MQHQHTTSSTAARCLSEITFLSMAACAFASSADMFCSTYISPSLRAGICKLYACLLMTTSSPDSGSEGTASEGEQETARAWGHECESRLVCHCRCFCTCASAVCALCICQNLDVMRAGAGGPCARGESPRPMFVTPRVSHLHSPYASAPQGASGNSALALFSRILPSSKAQARTCCRH